VQVFFLPRPSKEQQTYFRENNQQFIPFYIWSTNINIAPPLERNKNFVILSVISCYMSIGKGCLEAGFSSTGTIYNKIFESLAQPRKIGKELRRTQVR
jgi:hypothetical protein